MLTYVIVLPGSVEVYVDRLIAETRFNTLTEHGLPVQMFRRIPLGIPQEMTDKARAAIRKELAEVEALLTNHSSRRSDILAGLRRAEDFVASVSDDGEEQDIIDHMAEAGPAQAQR